MGAFCRKQIKDHCKERLTSKETTLNLNPNREITTINKSAYQAPSISRQKQSPLLLKSEQVSAIEKEKDCAANCLVEKEQNQVGSIVLIFELKKNQEEVTPEQKSSIINQNRQRIRNQKESLEKIKIQIINKSKKKEMIWSQLDGLESPELSSTLGSPNVISARRKHAQKQLKEIDRSITILQKECREKEQYIDEKLENLSVLQASRQLEKKDLSRD